MLSFTATLNGEGQTFVIHVKEHRNSPVQLTPSPTSPAPSWAVYDIEKCELGIHNIFTYRLKSIKGAGFVENFLHSHPQNLKQLILQQTSKPLEIIV